MKISITDDFAYQDKPETIINYIYKCNADLQQVVFREPNAIIASRTITEINHPWKLIFNCQY